MTTKKTKASAKQSTRKPAKKSSLIPIILCAGENGRAVIFGRVEKLPTPGQPVTLRDARMVLYWSSDCGGLFGLAAAGPKTSTRITRTIPSTCETRWQEYAEVEPAAAAAIDRWPSC